MISVNDMYSKLPNLTIAFHGCDKTVYDSVLHNEEPLIKSKNPYDWLGNGIYFWENNYQRAYEWAKNSSKIKNPAVIGAIIDLGNCLNLTDNKSTDIIKVGYELLKAHMDAISKPLPVNRNIKGNKDLLIRDLDCAVIQQIHAYNNEHNLPAFDSVRGVFIEGSEIYPNSGFMDKTHIQICVVNPNCIKGYFAPITQDTDYVLP